MSNTFQDAKIAYTEINNLLSAKEFDCKLRRDAVREKYFNDLKISNDQAYYLYLFTRLEGHIENKFTQLVSHKKSTITNWQDKSAWEAIDPKRFGFMNKVALLTRKGYAMYRQIKIYYDDRNSIAHGNSSSSFVDIQQVILDFENIIIAI